TKSGALRKLRPRTLSRARAVTAMSGHCGPDMSLPNDFRAVDSCVPEWIDIKEICHDAKRYVGLYALSNVDAVAINNGRAIYTTSDRNGEFRAMFNRIVGQTYRDAAIVDGSPT